MTATDTETAVTDLESQMQGVYSNDSASQLWSMIGITEMPGIDDYGPDETFTEAQPPVLPRIKTRPLS